MEGLLVWQTSTVEEYPSRFEQLSNITHNWSERQLVETFIEGLQPEILREVKAQRSQTIISAISFARIEYERLGEKTAK